MRVELSPAECERIIREHSYAHLGCIDADGRPFVYPITYAFHDGMLFGVTVEGHKISMMRAHPRICVQVERVSGEHDWESVMCFGSFEEITDPAEIQQAKLLFGGMRGKAVLAGQEPPVTTVVHGHHDVTRPTVAYRVKPDGMTGRAQRPA